MDFKQLSEELHRRTHRPKEYRKVVVFGKDQIWTLDLFSMQTYADENDGYNYGFVVLDVFSRFAWVVPLKTKEAKESWAALQTIMDTVGVVPQLIWSDDGTEYINRVYKTNEKKLGIEHYKVHGTHKAAIAERFIRTIKRLMWKRFTEVQSHRWVDIISELVDEYNSRKHRTLGMSPKEARKPENEPQILVSQTWSHFNPVIDKKPKFKVGDWVRMSRLKGTFEQGFLPSYGFEALQVVEVDPAEPVMYRLKDWLGEELDGRFYESELTGTQVPDVILMDQVLKTRTRKGKKEHFVSWIGWPKKYNKWISDDELIAFKK